jgi:hypothetical protein
MTFGYDASITIMAQKSLMGIHDHATNLLGRLRNERATMAVRRFPDFGKPFSSDNLGKEQATGLYLP